MTDSKTDDELVAEMATAAHRLNSLVSEIERRGLRCDINLIDTCTIERYPPVISVMVERRERLMGLGTDAKSTAA